MSAPTRARFWADDFDADLLAVVPDVERELAAVPRSVRFYTHAHATHGRLNSPNAWHLPEGLTAFVGLSPERVGKPESFWTRDPIVECTFEELWRDLWVHNIATVLTGPVWSAWFIRGDQIARQQDLLMFNLRGWRSYAPRDVWWAQESTRRAIRRSVAVLREVRRG